MQKISWWRTEISEAEIARVVQSIKEERVSQGKVTAEFEARLGELLGVKHVIACTSGSTALLMALLAAGIKRDDEVIVPNRTWIATAHAVMIAGGKVVLADDDPIDKSVFVEDARRKITPRTKFILPVQLGGRSVDMDGVHALAKQYNLQVIEDAAQAFMSRNAHGFLGTQSVAGCFSLSLAKLICTGQGGFVVTNDPEIHRICLCMRNHGVEDPVHVIYSRMGFNFRFNDVLASIGVTQLQTVEARMKHVTEIYKLYEVGLRGLDHVQFIPVDLAGGEIPVYAEVLAKDRSHLESYLAENGVQIRPYYPNLNLAPQMADASSFPYSAEYGKRGLFLPCGPTQPLENVQRVIELLHRFA
jgi:perosamine synthetase